MTILDQQTVPLVVFPPFSDKPGRFEDGSGCGLHQGMKPPSLIRSPQPLLIEPLTKYPLVI